MRKGFNVIFSNLSTSADMLFIEKLYLTETRVTRCFFLKKSPNDHEKSPQKVAQTIIFVKFNACTLFDGVYAQGVLCKYKKYRHFVGWQFVHRRFDVAPFLLDGSSAGLPDVISEYQKS
jgi:hypothetical protein